MVQFDDLELTNETSSGNVFLKIRQHCSNRQTSGQ